MRERSSRSSRPFISFHHLALSPRSMTSIVALRGLARRLAPAPLAFVASISRHARPPRHIGSHCCDVPPPRFVSARCFLGLLSRRRRSPPPSCSIVDWPVAISIASPRLSCTMHIVDSSARPMRSRPAEADQVRLASAHERRRQACRLQDGPTSEDRVVTAGHRCGRSAGNSARPQAP